MSQDDDTTKSHWEFIAEYPGWLVERVMERSSTHQEMISVAHFFAEQLTAGPNKTNHGG